jgi:hypothetical protein
MPISGSSFDLPLVSNSLTKSSIECDLRLDQGDGGTVEADETSSRSDVRDGSGSLLFAEGLNSRHLVGVVKGKESEVKGE